MDRKALDHFAKLTALNHDVILAALASCFSANQNFFCNVCRFDGNVRCQNYLFLSGAPVSQGKAPDFRLNLQYLIHSVFYFVELRHLMTYSWCHSTTTMYWTLVINASSSSGILPPDLQLRIRIQADKWDSRISPRKLQRIQHTV